MVKGWQVWPDARIQLSHLSSFPLRENGWSKPLDSGLRRNDGGGWGQEFSGSDRGAVRMTTNPFPPQSSFMDTPAWMQVVERRLEQAAEEVRYAARGHAYRT